MTYEELKAEAKSQGYKLIPIPKAKEKMMPCPICRTSRRDYRYGLDIRMEVLPDKELGWKKRHIHYYGFCQHCKQMKGPIICDPPSKKDVEPLVIHAWNEYIMKGETYWDEHPEQKTK